jgi:ppGpp synthetase/RelA/SpoT-type nucleotidyltranferase
MQNILLIDKDFNNYIKGFSTVAKTYDFSIMPFCFSKDGISNLKLNINQIGVVLLALNSLEYNEKSALNSIKEINSLLPVIILCGNAKKEIEIAVECMKNGAFNYIVRTEIEIDFLFKMLKVVVEQYKLNNESKRKNLLEEEYRKKISVSEKMLITTEMILKNILKDKLMFPPTFESRRKTFESFYKKVKLKEEVEGHIEFPFKRITDLAGLRVIFFNAKDLQTAVDLMKISTDFIDADTQSNSITADDKSKTYGYRAVHFDIKLNANTRLQLSEYVDLSDMACEVQFKTVFAHSWSKIHHVLSYKEIDNLNLTKEDHDKLNTDFIEAAKSLEEIEKRITDLCTEYYPQSTNSLTKTN